MRPEPAEQRALKIKSDADGEATNQIDKAGGTKKVSTPIRGGRPIGVGVPFLSYKI